jgi:putative copper resistance protein D
MTPETALACTRFLRDSSLSLLWGGLGYSSCIAGLDLAKPLLRLMEKPAFVAVGVLVAVSVVALPVETADITGQWVSSLDLSTLHLVVETAVGQAVALQAATAIGVLVAILLRAHRTSVAIAALMLCELSLSGHAAEGSGLSGLTHQLIASVHVLSGTAWLGGLLPFMAVLRMSAVPELRQAAVAAMRRFSKAGHIAVALMLISGIANIWLTLGRLPFDFTPPYDQKLCLKLLAVGLMTLLAIVNRYAFVPMFRRQACLPRSLLIYGCVAEIALGTIAIGLVASFGLQDPA